jgi:hypothetical protein
MDVIVLPGGVVKDNQGERRTEGAVLDLVESDVTLFTRLGIVAHYTPPATAADQAAADAAAKAEADKAAADAAAKAEADKAAADAAAKAEADKAAADAAAAQATAAPAAKKSSRNASAS